MTTTIHTGNRQVVYEVTPEANAPQSISKGLVSAAVNQVGFPSELDAIAFVCQSAVHGNDAAYVEGEVEFHRAPSGLWVFYRVLDDDLGHAAIEVAAQLLANITSRPVRFELPSGGEEDS